MKQLGFKDADGMVNREVPDFFIEVPISPAAVSIKLIYLAANLGLL